jgi:hypothetical protein
MTQQTQQSATPISSQLDKIGDGQSIPRNDGESDADYAERMVYELDIEVENLWAVQDSIRALVPVAE